MFAIDTAARELIASGAPVSVEPKILDLLVCLIEGRDHVVSKDELVRTVWNNRIISDAAISSAISALRKALGDDGQRQRYVKTMHGRGFRFVGPVMTTDASDGASTARSGQEGMAKQEIRYCRSLDGTRIAYAIAGQGPPLVKPAHWLHHLEFDWESPVWRHVFEDLARKNRLVRYDGRGLGLSSWDADDLSFDRQMEDLDAVISQSGLDRFAMLGMAQGALKSIAYAAQHPERVTKLVILGGFARGWNRQDPERSFFRQGTLELIRAAWGKNNPAIRQMFTSLYMPDAPPESQSWFSELQRRTANAENAARTLEVHGNVDVRDLLSKISSPTLVIHSRRDAAVPFELGQEVAAGIPGARFAVLDTANHILPATDPAWNRCAGLIQEFLTYY
ncbi:MAG: alpha/beta fold hydrolase [Rhodobacteraceae bacterium]|nr:alpha/beta fold hydrolase [Paracoccaceae bacterium]